MPTYKVTLNFETPQAMDHRKIKRLVQQMLDTGENQRLGPEPIGIFVDSVAQAKEV